VDIRYGYKGRRTSLTLNCAGLVYSVSPDVARTLGVQHGQRIPMVNGKPFGKVPEKPKFPDVEPGAGPQHSARNTHVVFSPSLSKGTLRVYQFNWKTGSTDSASTLCRM
jgi:hypothetical protein